MKIDGGASGKISTETTALRLGVRSLVSGWLGYLKGYLPFIGTGGVVGLPHFFHPICSAGLLHWIYEIREGRTRSGKVSLLIPFIPISDIYDFLADLQRLHSIIGLAHSSEPTVFREMTT